MKEAKFVLSYIRNGKEVLFPVSSFLQAILLAEQIANSDLLNDSIDYNAFDLFHYKNGKTGEPFETEDGIGFDEIWKDLSY